MKKQEKQNEKKKPLLQLRSGLLWVSVWENNSPNGSNGKGYKNISIIKSYKDKNGTWNNTKNVNIDDVPKLIMLLNKAYSEVVIQNSNI